MLEKDPADRITWEELLENPYWDDEDISELKYKKFPNELQFNSYLEKLGRKRRIAPSQVQQELL